MKKYIILFVLFLACAEEPKPLYNCFTMTISDAIPVQFWQNNLPTFNEKEEPGIDKVCFFQPFICGDNIKLQFKKPFVTSAATIEALTGWDNVETEGPLNDWITGAYPNVTSSGAAPPTICGSQTLAGALGSLTNGVSYRLRITYTHTPNVSYPTSDGIELRVGEIIGVSPTASLTVEATNSESSANGAGFMILDFVASAQTLFAGVIANQVAGANMQINSATIELTPTPHYLNIYDNDDVLLNQQDFTSEITPDDEYIYSLSFVPDDIAICGQKVYFEIWDDTEKLGYGDLLDIASEHSDSRLIRYSNQQDFASINYDGDTPPEFNFRVRAKFFKVRFPQEDESEALSNGSIVKLSGTVKEQKLFETEPLPAYIQKKLALIFQHDTIYIDNESWIKEEAYEIELIDERNPLFNGKVWLTKSTDNFIANA